MMKFTLFEKLAKSNTSICPILNKYLSETEKETSKLVQGDFYRPTNLIFPILKIISSSEGNDKIVRIIINEDCLIKLQSYDNGTPFIIYFEEGYYGFDDIKIDIKSICKKFNLIYTEYII